MEDTVLKDAALNSTAKLIYVMTRRWPDATAATLAEHAACSERTVYRAFASLRQRGYGVRPSESWEGIDRTTDNRRLDEMMANVKPLEEQLKDAIEQAERDFYPDKNDTDKNDTDKNDTDKNDTDISDSDNAVRLLTELSQTDKSVRIPKRPPRLKETLRRAQKVRDQLFEKGEEKQLNTMPETLDLISLAPLSCFSCPPEGGTRKTHSTQDQLSQKENNYNNINNIYNRARADARGKLGSTELRSTTQLGGSSNAGSTSRSRFLEARTRSHLEPAAGRDPCQRGGRLGSPQPSRAESASGALQGAGTNPAHHQPARSQKALGGRPEGPGLHSGRGPQHACPTSGGLLSRQTTDLVHGEDHQAGGIGDA